MSTPRPTPRHTRRHMLGHTVGLDAGATLCKLALWSEGLRTELFPSTDLEAARQCIERWQPRQIVATGGGALQLGGEVAGIPVEQVHEFEAWARGVALLAQRDGIELPERHLLVSLGTGTSVLVIEGDHAERVGGSALGGGTLMGLGRLLLGVSSFREVTELAARGDRRRVDLLVGDIYPEGKTPIPPQITAASFGKLASTQPEDLAHALIGLLAENIGMICADLGRIHGVTAVVYGGSTLTDNPLLQETLSLVTRACNGRAHFLRHSAFCGAIGAAALARPS